MKKIVFLIMCLCSVYANSQEGVPFFVNYPASVWRANLCATFLGNLVYPTPASKMLHFP